MSLRRLYGWEPQETTTVTAWDEQGRPARWVTVKEPEWDRRERSLMQALSYWESGQCQRCHQHLSESMDPRTDPDNPDAEQMWVAEGPDHCHACKALVRAERSLSKAEGGADMLPYSIHTPVLIERPG